MVGFSHLQEALERLHVTFQVGLGQKVNLAVAEARTDAFLEERDSVHAAREADHGQRRLRRLAHVQ